MAGREGKGMPLGVTEPGGRGRGVCSGAVDLEFGRRLVSWTQAFATQIEYNFDFFDC